MTTPNPDLHSLAQAADLHPFAAAVAELLQPTPEPAPEKPLWAGDVQAVTFGQAPPLSIFPRQGLVPGHVFVSPDPLGSARKVITYAINDADRTYSGATNPRGDLESPRLLGLGTEAWLRVCVYLPKSIPLVQPPGSPPFFQWCEIYGPPYGGSPPVGMGVEAVNGVNRLVMRRGRRYNYDRPWLGPPLPGGWQTIYLHWLGATDQAGFVELYLESLAGQQLLNGVKRLQMVTLDPGVNWDGKTANDLNVNHYRAAEMWPGTVTTYHGEAAIGADYASVEALPLP